MMELRNAISDNLIDSYSEYFNIIRSKDDFPYFKAECDFNMHSEKFVLTKKAKLWAVDSFEYVFIFNVPYLTDLIYDRCLDYSYKHGMERIEPGPEHMCSYITMIIICDNAEDSALKKIHRCHLHKDFRFSLYGWMDFHTAAIMADSGQIITNSAGRDNAKNLKTIYLSQKGRKV